MWSPAELRNRFDVEPRFSGRRATSFWLLVVVLAASATAYVVATATVHPDCFWHLCVADQLLTDGIGPLVDRLAFTSVQQPWTPYSWLAELGMKLVWDAGGYRLMLATQAGLIVAFAALLAAGCASARPARPQADRFTLAAEPGGPARTPASRLSAAVAVAAGLFLALPHLSFRPATAAVVLLAAATALMTRDRAGGEQSRGVWLCAPLTAVCVNLHLYAVFIPLWFGVLLIAAIWERWAQADTPERPEAERRCCRYLWLTLATALSACCTPMLPGVISTGVHYLRTDPMVAGGFLPEMRPFYAGRFGEAQAIVIAVAALLIVTRLGRLRTGERLLLAAAAVLLTQWARLMPVFVILVMPALCVALARVPDAWLNAALVRRTLAAAAVVAVAAVVALFPRSDERLTTRLDRPAPDAPVYPVAAATYVKQVVEPKSGRLISEFDWGGYLEWSLGHEYQLFVDGRTQLFAPDFWRATYLGSAADRQRFLAVVEADAAIVPRHDSLFRHALVQNGWRTAYRDDHAEVLLPPEPAASTPEPERWTFTDLLN